MTSDRALVPRFFDFHLIKDSKRMNGEFDWKIGFKYTSHSPTSTQLGTGFIFQVALASVFHVDTQCIWKRSQFANQPEEKKNRWVLVKLATKLDCCLDDRGNCIALKNVIPFNESLHFQIDRKVEWLWSIENQENFCISMLWISFREIEYNHFRSNSSYKYLEIHIVPFHCRIRSPASHLVQHKPKFITEWARFTVS